MKDNREQKYVRNPGLGQEAWPMISAESCRESDCESKTEKHMAK